MTKGQKLFIMLAGIVMIFAGAGYFYKLFADKRNSEMSIAYGHTQINHPQTGNRLVQYVCLLEIPRMATRCETFSSSIPMQL